MNAPQTDEPLTNLDAILSPVTAEHFFAHYWESRPLHIEREKNNPFHSLVSRAAIKALLSGTQQSFPDVQLTQASCSIAAEEYSDEYGTIQPNHLLRRHRAGATIILSQAHRKLAALGEFCRQLQAAFQWVCQANVYLSPPGRQGFNPHFDAHDVFILQVSGSKSFRFYEGGVNLPRQGDRFDAQIDKPGAPGDVITLNPGDTLYIPRGVMHDAQAHDQASSLHITLGVYPVTVQQLCATVLDMASDNLQPLRQSLSREIWTGTEDMSASQLQQLQSQIVQALSPALIERALTQLRDEVSLQGVASCGGLLAQGAVRLSAHSTLIVQSHRVMNVHQHPDGINLRLVGEILEFHEPLAGAVQWLLTQSSVRLSGLPNLSEEQQLALGQQLVEHDVVQLALESTSS